MGLFTVGLRDDDCGPAYKFPALPHRARGRCLVAFAGVHLAVHVVRDLVHIDADTTNHGVYAADDFAGCRAAPFSCAILVMPKVVKESYDDLIQGETMTFSRFIEEIQGLQADRPQSLTLL